MPQSYLLIYLLTILYINLISNPITALEFGKSMTAMRKSPPETISD